MIQTKRLIYHCKRCGYTITQDVAYIWCGWDYNANDYVYALDHPYRIVATQRIECPNCSKPSWKRIITANAVKGYYNPDHECGDECLNATTASCSCGCGGANHGGKYLVSQRVTA